MTIEGVEAPVLPPEYEQIATSHFDPKVIIGNSPIIKDVLERANKIAASDANVLIQGETGTGKELLANFIHYNSKRKYKKFIKVNCAALQETLLESELFGHEKGSFTGAHVRKVGKFEAADGGTIFLDEIGDMSPAVQAKVLRVLEEGTFERVGGINSVHTNVRVISATNVNLNNRISEDKFRKDLYYRLNITNIHIPPLVCRGDDIDLLTNHFLNLFTREMNKSFKGFTKDAINLLKTHRWPGNIRELRNVIQKAIILTRDKEFIADFDLELDVISADIVEMSDNDAYDRILFSTMEHNQKRIKEGLEKEPIIEEVNKRLIIRALGISTNQAEAASHLGISRRVMTYTVEKYNIPWRLYLRTSSDSETDLEDDSEETETRKEVKEVKEEKVDKIEEMINSLVDDWFNNDKEIKEEPVKKEKGRQIPYSKIVAEIMAEQKRMKAPEIIRAVELKIGNGHKKHDISVRSAITRLVKTDILVREDRGIYVFKESLSS